MITPEIFVVEHFKASNAGAKKNNGLNLVWYLQTQVARAAIYQRNRCRQVCILRRNNSEKMT